MRCKWSSKQILSWSVIPIAFVAGLFDVLSNFQVCQADSLHQEYLTQESLQPKTLKFSAHGCHPKSSVTQGEETWKDQNTFLIKRYVLVNCGQKIESGNYKTDGNKLLLEFTVSGTYLLCKCPAELSYEITNLIRGDYDIELFQVDGAKVRPVKPLSGPIEKP
jgi:hypothetical protein